MVFTILGSVAELERPLIGERVRAGLRNAKAKGQRLGRPPLKQLTASDVRQLRKDRRRARLSVKELVAKHGVSTWTAFQLCKSKGEKSKDF
jgi:DNA invertase Pin-like site-specific DNA recombinase